MLVDRTYSIRFTEDKDGAIVGQHKVTVRTATVDEIRVEDKTTGLMVTTELPESHQPKLALEYSREIKPGANEIVFDLAEGTPASDGSFGMFFVSNYLNSIEDCVFV